MEVLRFGVPNSRWTFHSSVGWGVTGWADGTQTRPVGFQSTEQAVDIEMPDAVPVQGFFVVGGDSVRWAQLGVLSQPQPEPMEGIEWTGALRTIDHGGWAEDSMEVDTGEDMVDLEMADVPPPVWSAIAEGWNSSSGISSSNSGISSSNSDRSTSGSTTTAAATSSDNNNSSSSSSSSTAGTSASGNGERMAENAVGTGAPRATGTLSVWLKRVAERRAADRAAK